MMRKGRRCAVSGPPRFGFAERGGLRDYFRFGSHPKLRELCGKRVVTGLNVTYSLMVADEGPRGMGDFQVRENVSRREG